MKEITISMQAEFDALNSPKEFTKIFIVGELQKINREIENAVIHISDNAKVDYIFGSAKVGNISGSAKVGDISDSAKVDNIFGSAKVDYISGSAKVDYISGSAKVDYIFGSAKVDYIFGSAKVDYIFDNAKVDYIFDNAKVNNIFDNAKVDNIFGSAKVDYIFDNAKVDYISGSAKVDYIFGSAKVDYIFDNAKVDYISDNGSANIHNDCSPVLDGYGVVWVFNDLSKPVQKSKTSVVLRPNLDPLELYFSSNPIDISGKTVLLYKKVSNAFQTQEGTKNETFWTVGKKIEHPNWNPVEAECGEGKFHACSKPIFCDEFRSNGTDRYVCIEVNKKDLFAWKNPTYPRKIAFQKGTVLYECDRAGEKI